MLSQERKKADMRRAMRSWPVRIGALALAGLLLYVAAYHFLPRTADRVSVTVVQCATPQHDTVYTCPGATLFHRTFTDAATVSDVRSTLEGMHEVGPFTRVWCSGDWGQSRVYRFDLLWHGLVVQTYVAPTSQDSRCWWYMTTLGVPQTATEGPTTIWKDLVRLTGMPDLPIPGP
jgi:hypothetical protein